MALLPSEHHYYLRSQSDKQHSLSTASPTSPPNSLSPIEHPIQSPPSPCTLTVPKTRKRRKRRFHQINANNNTDSDDDEQDIDLNTDTSTLSPVHKKAKLSRRVKFTLRASKPIVRKIKRIRLTFNKKRNNNKQNFSAVLSRDVSLNKDLCIAKRRCIESFEIPISYHRVLRRNPFICCYSFLNGYKIGITSTLGSGNDLKAAIKILSQELVSTRAKASIETQKNCFLVYIKTRNNTLIGCGILHIDHVWKRVNIEMFAVDHNWRGNGFASMMVYLIQYRMIHFAKYDLFVCAAKSAIPFWINKKYKFVLAHKGILEQHELDDEKKGGTKHFIWSGTTVTARCNLLKCFNQSQ